MIKAARESAPRPDDEAAQPQKTAVCASPRRRLLADEESGLYVFCIAGPGPISLPSFDLPVRVLNCGQLSALVTDVPLSEFSRSSLTTHQSNFAWLEDRVVRHDLVVREAMKHTTILPLRFGSIFTSEQALLDFLNEQRPLFARLLEKFAGRQEWGAKLFASPAALRPLSAARHASPTQASPGRGYLLHKRLQNLTRRKAETEVVATAAEIHHALSSHAVSSVVHTRCPCAADAPETLLLFSASYLVDINSVPAFLNTSRHLAARVAPSFRVSTSGPWPPYSFVSLEGASNV